MARRKPSTASIDQELTHLPPEQRWREWMLRIEAVIFASPNPVDRGALSKIVGRDANLELLIADLNRELKSRPYEIIEVAGGFRHRTRPGFAPVIRKALGEDERPDLNERDLVVLLVIAYYQPITRSDISAILGRDVSHDLLTKLRREDLIGRGPRSPQPGAPSTLITMPRFLERFGLKSLNELPELEKLREEGLLDKEALMRNLSQERDEVEDDWMNADLGEE